jgi:hypothetical protein
LTARDTLLEAGGSQGQLIVTSDSPAEVRRAGPNDSSVPVRIVDPRTDKVTAQLSTPLENVQFYSTAVMVPNQYQSSPSTRYLLNYDGTKMTPSTALMQRITDNHELIADVCGEYAYVIHGPTLEVDNVRTGELVSTSQLPAAFTDPDADLTVTMRGGVLLATALTRDPRNTLTAVMYSIAEK